MTVRLLCALSLAALAGGGCSRRAASSAEPPAPEAPVLTRCVNSAGRYSLAYPPDWKTNEGDAVEPCRLFHPTPFEVRRGTMEPAVAISVKAEPVSLARFVSASIAGFRVLRRDRLEVAGRKAVRLELLATRSSPFLRPGTREYLYAVADGPRTVRASTLGRPGDDYERNKAVLDEMMRTLELR